MEIYFQKETDACKQVELDDCTDWGVQCSVNSKVKQNIFSSDVRTVYIEHMFIKLLITRELVPSLSLGSLEEQSTWMC